MTSPRPIRISFVIDQLSRAGTESQLLALIRGLDRTQFEPSLVLLHGDSAESQELEPENCPVHRLGIRKLLSRTALRQARTLLRLWRSCPPDIVQTYFMDSAYFAVPVARWAGVKQILRVRNNLGYWLTPKHRVLGRLLRSSVRSVLTNTEQGREQLCRNEGWRSDQVHVIENGVDLDRFPPRRTTRHGDFRIGCVANLRPVKNIDGLMRVAARITSRHPSVRFLVAGDGEDRARLDALHQELALAEQWQFLGSTRDVPGFLATLDAAVLPSHSEGMSNAVLEYMAAGLPVIATNVGANARLLDNGKCGLLVPPGDEPALEQALDDVIQDEDHAARLGQAARLRVEAEYSRTAMIRRFEDFYRKLVFGGKI